MAACGRWLPWWTAQLKTEGAARTEPGEWTSLQGAHRRSFKLWTSSVLRVKGIEGGKISSRCIVEALEYQSAVFVLNSRGLRAERALCFALGRRTGRNVGGELKQGKVPPRGSHGCRG